jgi:Asp-tRNA(Asn)/Glu-tRNA(Gln) amidotransferase A subunit family amidase
MRIGVPAAACDEVDTEVLAAHMRSAQALRDLGVVVEEIGQPDAHDFQLSMLMGLVVSRCEAATYHLAFAGKESLYTTVVAEQMEEAARVSAVDYLKAQRWREEFRTRMRALLARYDGLLMPTTAIAAPKSTEVDEYFLILSRNCIPWSFIGFPACSVPAGRTGAGLPVGAQLVTGPREDGRLLALAAALERALGDGR